MKTTKLFLTIAASVIYFGQFAVNAQATQATNAITSGSYLGTSNNFDVVFKRNAISAGYLGASNVILGLNSNIGASALGVSGVAIGVSAGQFSTASSSNSNNFFIGNNAGKGQSASILNTGSGNSFVGNNTGKNNTSGNFNTFLGSAAGLANTSGSSNVFLGNSAGSANTTGSNNILIGESAGSSITTQSGNVVIGPGNDSLTPSDDKLFIDNTYTDSPLIWGDFANDQVKLNGKVGIGAVASFPTNSLYTSYKLFVTGGILADEVRVALSSSGAWPDYVFNKDYNLKPLSEVETFIKQNGHLQNVPSAAQVKDEGIELGEIAKVQQEKIEELTLYIIELNKKLDAQQKQIDALIQNNR